MKITLLNKQLETGKCTRTRFLCPPLMIPVNENGSIDEKGGKIHYCAVVMVEPERDLAIFEYNQSIQFGLLGYAHRGNLENMEILLSREDSGEIRMTSGRTNESDTSMILPVAQRLHQVLPEMYRSKAGYFVQDFS